MARWCANRVCSGTAGYVNRSTMTDIRVPAGEALSNRHDGTGYNVIDYYAQA